jgi:hypothetical protein
VAVATGIFTRAELSSSAPDCLLDDFSDPRDWLRQLA